ncbi:MAG: radical SAM-associated putative lipoprotein [Bacteroidales bacterium]|nr:radical SAM-associated putative lipoprotein [Bacteroidales bacterium]
MRDLFLRLCRWALPLLGISGAISCDNVIQTYDMYGCPPAEYGVPTMEFRMKGKVVDSESDQPVKGIAVTRINENTSIESTDTVWTAENGEFFYQGTDFPSESMILKFTDVDGVENHGMFHNKEVKVKLTREEGSQEGWFTGVYISDDVLVKLDAYPAPEYGLPYSEYSAKKNAE